MHVIFFVYCLPRVCVRLHDIVAGGCSFAGDRKNISSR